MGITHFLLQVILRLALRRVINSEQNSRDWLATKVLQRGWSPCYRIICYRMLGYRMLGYRTLVRPILALMLVLGLAACGEPESKNKGATALQPIAGVTTLTDQVYDFKAFPGNQSVTLRWNNPNSAIEFYNLTVYASGSIVAEASNEHLDATDGVNLQPDARGVEYTIERGLENNRGYSFEISVHLVGDGAFNVSRPVVRLGGRRNITAPPTNSFGVPRILSNTSTNNGDITVIGPNRDDDEYADIEDNCPNSPASLRGTADSDDDGCFYAEDAFPRDPAEWLDTDGDRLGNNIDPDDDNDGYLDRSDSCPAGVANWVANSFWDYDEDGCNDPAEDLDDDNDKVADAHDFCRRGVKGWSSTSGTDYDGDGCRDDDEDSDDDGDKIIDLRDNCHKSIMRFKSTPNIDNDRDGCSDVMEDDDDDNDGVNDYEDGSDNVALDNCQFAANPFQEDNDQDDSGDACDDDDDNDNVKDVDDVDDNGNGLIEIATARELNTLRYNLAGTSLATEKSSPSAAEQGCVSGLAGVSNCYGYELIADIDLRGYPNWQPIGACEPANGQFAVPKCKASNMFRGVFEGNNHTISRLTISPTEIMEDVFGMGLFGAVAPGAELRNISLRDVSISSSFLDNPTYVGALAGLVDGATIIDASVTNGALDATAYVGGLIGYANDCSIISSYADIADISIKKASDNSPSSAGGGLVGGLTNCTTRHSYAITDIINTTSEYAGGLVGVSNASQIHSSYARTATLTNDASTTGGLIGMAESSQIYASLGWTSYVSGGGVINSFVGVATGNTSIGFSYVYADDRVPEQAAAFIGIAPQANIVLENSYAISDNEDTLWRGAATPTIRSSYWNSDSSNATVDAYAKTQSELITPTEFSGIYSDWGEGWCNPHTGEFTTTESIAMAGGYADNFVWDLGSASITAYPTLTCLNSFTAEEQLTELLD